MVNQFTNGGSNAVGAILSELGEDANQRPIHIVAQLSVCGYSCLYTTDGDSENHWIFANHLWDYKEEYLPWHDGSYNV